MTHAFDKGSNKTQTTTQQTSLPPYIDSYAQTNLNQAATAARTLPAPVMGRSTFANENQVAGWNQAGEYAEAAQPGLNEAAGTFSDLQNYQAGKFTDADISKYMNPYIDNVENRALDNMDRQRQMALNGVGSSAVGAHAFGGSRQGIMEGVTNAESVRSMGDMSAKLRADAFNTAAGLISGDQNRDLEAAKLRGTAATGGANTATAMQQAGLQGAAAMQAAGADQRSIALQNEQIRMDNANKKRNLAQEKLGIRTNALANTPYGKTSTTQTPVQAPNPFLGALGGAAAGTSIAGALGMSTPAWGTGAGALLGFLSDKRMKEDIEHVGKDPKTGLDLYAFRYKGDPKHYPKVVGPMAQDIEKKFPHSVARIKGGEGKGEGHHKVVTNMGFGGY